MNKSIISELISKNNFIMLDGAMGTMLQNKGLKLGELPELLNITNPDIIKEIHREYVEAGADIIYANTFGANAYKLKGCKQSVSEIIKCGVKIAKEVTTYAYSKTAKKTYVALDLGPIGIMLKPTGTLSFDEAYNIFKEMILAGHEADIIVIETMTSLIETKAAILAAKENSDKPIIATMTFEQNGRTFTGCNVISMAVTLSSLGVDAIGFNCSLGPDELYPLVTKITEWTDIPVVIKPNAGLPDPVTNTYNITPSDFAKSMIKMAECGAVIFGGCCGTNPEFIKETKKELCNFYQNNNISITKKMRPPVVCSSNGYVTLDEPRVIGERINPTGKKIFKEALLNHDLNYILKQASSQIDAGADILDVNVGLPGVDELTMMTECVEKIQEISQVPLQIDSTDPLVIENALRIYDGVAIVNSVNGEEESLNSILPIVAKYGAMVVGLTLDKNGIPNSVEGRINIAKKIINKAKEYGISEDKIIIDCLTLTASAEQEAAFKTINAIEELKKLYNIKTVLGVSNISFGLPNRELINRTFLSMALTKGLDLAIINPNNLAMMETFAAYKVLANIDKNSVNYIEFATKNEEIRQDLATFTSSNDDLTTTTDKLEIAIIKGFKDECATITSKLLETMPAMDIINNILIKALDKTGDDFEKGKIFLPQLIMSASAASACFDEIKKTMSLTSNENANKGKIVIATVKGDVHDIGKNIVKVLLENYGYDVIDLGKDVEYIDVVNAVKKHNAKLVGLSALMTTTLSSMKNTIKLIKENNLDCKIMVGGAVLTPEYAVQIGADFYAKDAKQSVDIAKKVLG